MEKSTEVYLKHIVSRASTTIVHTIVWSPDPPQRLLLKFNDPCSSPTTTVENQWLFRRCNLADIQSLLALLQLPSCKSIRDIGGTIQVIFSGGELRIIIHREILNMLNHLQKWAGQLQMVVTGGGEVNNLDDSDHILMAFWIASVSEIFVCWF